MSDYVRRVGVLDAPIASRLAQLDIELTERCDNDCIHCCINLPAGDAAARAREMTTEQVEDILRQAADLGCLSVRFTGGEPLLRPDFEDLYGGARRLGLAVLLFTNARRITPELADLLARMPPRELVEVTVYGMHQESYEAVSRVPGSYAQFRRGVDLLLEREVPFVVKGALLPPNRAEIDVFEAWARTIPWMTKSPDYAMFLGLRDRRNDPAKNRLIASLRVSPQDYKRVYQSGLLDGVEDASQKNRIAQRQQRLGKSHSARIPGCEDYRSDAGAIWIHGGSR